MQHWIELSAGLVAAASLTMMACQGIGILAAWRRSAGSYRR
jgi:hypothetical protein